MPTFTPPPPTATCNHPVLVVRTEATGELGMRCRTCEVRCPKISEGEYDAPAAAVAGASAIITISNSSNAPCSMCRRLDDPRPDEEVKTLSCILCKRPLPARPRPDSWEHITGAWPAPGEPVAVFTPEQVGVYLVGPDGAKKVK